MGKNHLMKAFVLDTICDFTENGSPLTLTGIPDQSPVEGEILVRVSACGMCHTALHELKEGIIRGTKVLQIGENKNA